MHRSVPFQQPKAQRGYLEDGIAIRDGLATHNKKSAGEVS
jgi:hypothetical protein